MSKTNKCPRGSKSPKCKSRYIYAFDPKIKRRVVHVIKKGVATSLISGNRFKYKSKKRVK